MKSPYCQNSLLMPFFHPALWQTEISRPDLVEDPGLEHQPGSWEDVHRRRQFMWKDPCVGGGRRV